MFTINNVDLSLPLPPPLPPKIRQPRFSSSSSCKHSRKQHGWPVVVENLDHDHNSSSSFSDSVGALTDSETVATTVERRESGCCSRRSGCCWRAHCGMLMLPKDADAADSVQLLMHRWRIMVKNSRWWWSLGKAAKGGFGVAYTCESGGFSRRRRDVRFLCRRRDYGFRKWPARHFTAGTIRLTSTGQTTWIFFLFNSKEKFKKMLKSN